MGLNENLNKIMPYFKGIDVIDGKLIVKLDLEKGWFCYEKPDKFNAIRINDTTNSWAVMCDANSEQADEIFSFIEEIIQTNKSVKLKMDLLKVKMNELKELFAVTPFEDLINLKFTFTNNDNVKKKRKYTKRNKKNNEIETNTENNNEINENIENELV